MRVFVHFASLEGARKAREALDGRFFSGRSIKAAFYDDEKFKARSF